MRSIEHNLVPGKKVTQPIGAPIYPDQARARPATVRTLIWLQLLLGLGAVFGGGVLILAPDGHLIGMPMNLLANSPFTNFLVPGLLLFFFVGVFPSVVAYSLWQRPAWGALILILTLLPSVRRHFALPDSAAIGRSPLV